jgi:hypothetical protein
MALVAGRLITPLLALSCTWPDFPRKVHQATMLSRPLDELLSNLVFEGCRSCGDLAVVGGFNSVFERDAFDDFGEVIKAA